MHTHNLTLQHDFTHRYKSCKQIQIDPIYTPTRPKRQQHHYQVLKMINTDNTTGSSRKGSYFIQKSLSNTSEDTLIQDRFIPSRRLITQFDMNQKMEFEDENRDKNDPQVMTVAEIYSQEILGKNIKKLQNHNENDINSFKNKNILKFKLQNNDLKPSNNNFIHSPLRQFSNSNSNININTKNRKICKHPCKILDAPSLTDDFYLNLVDWSNQNILAVGLSNCIYLWNAVNSRVTKLCEIPDDTITSLCWSPNNSTIAVGCNKGNVLIWDVTQQKQIRKLEGHQMRVGSMAWSNNFLATGSRDKSILQRDLRSQKKYAHKLLDHTQQICGMKWSKDDQYLASGGNDNKVIVWNNNGQAINKFCDHKAAVKAIAWSPHYHGLLATGGGTADRCLKMRNIFTGQILCSQDTGSQICNLQFSKTLHEVVSTHGYSQNQINIWSYPNMKKVASLKGHTHRVLYLALSADGSTIVTGAGDQTLRFWNVFPAIGQGYKKQSYLEGYVSCR